MTCDICCALIEHGKAERHGDGYICESCADDALPCAGAESCPCAHQSTCGACDHASMADCECCEATESFGGDTDIRG